MNLSTEVLKETGERFKPEEVKAIALVESKAMLKDLGDDAKDPEKFHVWIKENSDTLRKIINGNAKEIEEMMIGDEFEEKAVGFIFNLLQEEKSKRANIIELDHVHDNAA